MAKITVEKFISTYKENPNTALLLLQQHSDDIPELFQSREQVHEFGCEVTQKASDTIHDDSDFIAKLQEVYAPVKELLDRSATQISKLFTTAEQYIEFTKDCSYLASTLFFKDANRIAALFATYEQFIALQDASHSLAGDVFAKDSARIAALFATYDQFMALEDASHSLATNVFKKDPSRIAALFTSYDQFMALEDTSHSLANDVFKKDPSRIAALFATCDQFMTLEDRSHSLATDVFKKDPSRIAALFDTEQKLQHLKTRNFSLAKDIEQIRQREGMRTKAPSPVVPQASKIKEDDYQTEHDIDNPATATPEENNSFKLKCLASLALLGGTALIIVGIIVSQPLVVLAGVGLAGLGGAWLSGFFAHRSRPRNEFDEMPELFPHRMSRS